MNKIIQENIKDVTSSTESRQLTLWKREDLRHSQSDEVAEEVPTALVYNGTSYTMIVASSRDLGHFTMGFSFSEDIIESPQDIHGMGVVPFCNGLEVQVELSSCRSMRLKERRRALVGRTGRDVCDVEQLNDVGKPVQSLPSTQILDLVNPDNALRHLRDFQPVGQLAGCTYAVVQVQPSGYLAGGYEDVGRYVVLGELLGRRTIEGETWQQGAVLVSSRASYETVQKSAICGMEILLAVSAMITLAVEVARHCNLTLVGFCKPGKATIYTHSQYLAAL